MKTRIKLHLIIYIAFAGLFMACEKMKSHIIPDNKIHSLS